MLGYRDIAALMENRIRHGDYNFKPLPTERALSKEMEVSQKTARRALLDLEARGLIRRNPNTRPQIAHKGGRVLAFLAAISSRSSASTSASLLTSSAFLWESRAASAADAAGFTLQTLYYRHWDDPQIAEALENSAGVLLLPLREPIPERVRALVCASETPVALLGRDWSAYEIPSLLPFPSSLVGTLLEHLSAKGCDRITLFTAYSESPLVRQVIDHYHLWSSMQNKPPHVLLADQPEEVPFLERARKAAKKIHAAKPRPDAVLCLSELDAIGLSRGLLDSGIQPGAGITLAALNYEPLDLLPCVAPSIIHVQGDTQPALRHIIQWMARGGKNWVGPHLLSPWKCSIIDQS